jgi:phosphopantothenoylcysteine synthetase/decarboxylase
VIKEQQHQPASSTVSAAAVTNFLPNIGLITLKDGSIKERMNTVKLNLYAQ